MCKLPNELFWQTSPISPKTILCHMSDKLHTYGKDMFANAGNISYTMFLKDKNVMVERESCSWFFGFLFFPLWGAWLAAAL